MDRDKDGWADANNDKDYQDINSNSLRDTDEPERIDEDLSSDNTNDSSPGIIGIDDNGDGIVDNSAAASPNYDNDEDSIETEDSLNGIDADGYLDDDTDGSIDEDINKDMNNDGLPVADSDDDDEDGSIQEDWFDAVVFFLNGTTLMQRIPNINPANGADYTEYMIAENVSQLRIERLLGNDGQTVLVDITLQVSPANAESISLNTQVRIGAGL